MKREYRETGTFHHVTMRGGRGMNIVENDSDRWDFLKLLYYLNDTYQNQWWERDLKSDECKLFERPDGWPEQHPLVAIVAFCLHDNHFHLLVQEIREYGLSTFMHRLPNSMTRRYNTNHRGSGSIFQGSYQSRQISDDGDLMNVTYYVTVKNVLERYPYGGLEGAMKNFEKAHAWALEDAFSSYSDFVGERNSPILEKNVFKNVSNLPRDFNKESLKYLTEYLERKDSHDKDIFLE